MRGEASGTTVTVEELLRAGRGGRRLLQTIALVVALLLLLAAPAFSTPITIGAGGPSPFQVDPVYFIPPSGGNPNPLGLVDAGNGVDRAIGPTDFAISACGTGLGCELSITTNVGTPYQNPQYPANSSNPQTPQGTPTAAVPFVVDSTWSVTNTSGAALAGLWLLFTGVDFTGGYPTVGVGLDQNLYTIMSLDDGSGPAYYGALPIGLLASGQTKTLQVRYIVTGNLQDLGGNLVMPPLGVSGLVVPEPASTLLIGLGLSALALARRRR